MDPSLSDEERGLHFGTDIFSISNHLLVEQAVSEDDIPDKQLETDNEEATDEMIPF